MLSSPRLDRLGGIVAWSVIFLCTAGIASAVVWIYDVRDERLRKMTASNTSASADDTNPTLRITSKYAIGAHQLLPGATGPVIEQLRSQAKLPAERVAIAPIIAELQSKEAALEDLNGLPIQSLQKKDGSASEVAKDVATLRTIYYHGPGQVDATDRERLKSRMGYAGRLALTSGEPDTAPGRKAVLAAASLMVVVYLIGIGGLVVLFLAGVVLLILGLIAFYRRRIRLRYAEVSIDSPSVAPPPPPIPPGDMPVALSYMPMAMGLPTFQVPRRLVALGRGNGRTSPFTESFAIYLSTQTLLSLGLPLLFPDWPHFAYFAFMPLMVVFAMLWPRFRGVRGVEWRRGFGWTLPTRPWREIGFGFLGYLAGMPIVFVGILITALLNALSGAHPTHPIIQEVGQGGWPALGIFLLAAVWAPIVEETFFRGALFHSLRARWGWVVSALVSSLLFAGVHPQGWTVVPTLAALAIVFCGMRECRSSILASVTAHAMHNGATVLLMIFLMS